MTEQAPEPKAIERSELRERLEFSYRVLPSERHPSYSEDAVLADAELGLFGVFDGVGGHVGGKEASAAASDSVLREIRTNWDDVTDEEADTLRPSLANVLREANRAVISRGQELYLKTPKEKQAHWRSPQTTATIVKLHEFADGRVKGYIAHVGDCRAYVRRAGGTLELLTEDDDLLSDAGEVSRLEELFHVRLTESDIARYRKLMDVVEGETAMPDAVGRYLFHTRNIVGRTLGYDNGSSPMGVKTYVVDVQPDDTILLMSDGVHDNLSPERIEYLAASANGNDEMADRIASESYEYGHMAPEVLNPEAPVIRNKRDDIAVMAVRVRPRT